ncbi:MAG: zinc ABC transporter substrate-binding protein [Gammaproteobacteria bacterium]|nr:zinc ABC transporter substrate-binding protein [Gammaproteobacteria bacterium]
MAEGLRVAVTIRPLHSILSGLLAGGEAPQLLYPTRSALQHPIDEPAWDRLQKADLLFWVGPELEVNLATRLTEMPSTLQTVAMLDNSNIKVLPAADGMRDPYFWLDSRNMLILLDDLTRLLIERDPVRTHLYVRNRQRLLQEVAQMDRQMEYGYRSLQGSSSYLFHATQHYFAQAYALNIAAAVDTAPTSPYSTEMLLAARRDLQLLDIDCIITEQEYPQQGLMPMPLS